MISRGNPLGPVLLREMADRGILSDAAIPVGPSIGSGLPEPALAPQMSPVVGTSVSGRPLYPDAEGGVYSEKTVTFPIGDSWYTFPSVDASGNVMSEDQVADYVRKNGPVDPITGERFPTFSSLEEAERYAQERSSTRLQPKTDEKGPGAHYQAQQQQQAPEQDSGGGGILSGLGGLLGGGFSAPEGMNWKDLMFDAGVGMLTGQGDSFQKIGQGLAFARQSAAERRKQQQEQQRYEREFGLKERTADRQDALAEARLNQIEQDLKTGSIMHLGNGILWNAATGERVAPELAEEVQRRAVQRAAASAAVGRSPGRYMKDDFYDQDGNLVPRRFNDRSGEFEYNVNGQWTNEPPEGLMRPTDSAMRDYMGIGASRIEEISAAGEAAQDQLGTIREFNRVLDENPDLYTGAAADTINDLRRYALALGLPADQAQAASVDELKNLTMNLVMGRIQTTKGAISEREMEAFERSVPNIGQTPEGMRRVLGIMERGAERQIERGRFYERRAGRMPKWQIDEEWERYINANPVIEDLLPSSGGGGGRSTTTSTGVKWSLED